jgi:hypothetical protein
MKKSELKNIIKECVKEVIFEEGVLSGIISEVVQGVGISNNLNEAITAPPRPRTDNSQRIKEEIRHKIMGEAVAPQSSYENIKSKFSNPELFEGTRPITEGNGKGPLSGVSPGDPGVDISNIPGFGKWSQVAESHRK